MPRDYAGSRLPTTRSQGSGFDTSGHGGDYDFLAVLGVQWSAKTCDKTGILRAIKEPTTNGELGVL